MFLAGEESMMVWITVTRNFHRLLHQRHLGTYTTYLSLRTLSPVSSLQNHVFNIRSTSNGFCLRSPYWVLPQVIFYQPTSAFCTQNQTKEKGYWELQRMPLPCSRYIKNKPTSSVLTFDVAYLDSAHHFPHEEQSKLPVILGLHGSPGNIIFIYIFVNIITIWMHILTPSNS